VIRRLPDRRALLLALLLLAAAPAMAQSPPASACAALPETGRIGIPGRDRVVAATPNPDRTLRCPDDFRLEALARPPRCVAPGIDVADGNPRAACYTRLALGPMAPLPPRSRPTRSCDTPVTSTILRVEGRNLGLGDVSIGLMPATGITLTLLAESGPDVVVDADPVVQGCFAPDCRLVKLDITAAAPPSVRLQARLPDGEPVEQAVALPVHCPK
jgi:hypothetical protein